jgi:hypothetical protein
LDVGLLQLATWLLDQHGLHRHLLQRHLLPVLREQHLLLRLLVGHHARCAAAAKGAAGGLHQHAQLAAGAGAVARHAAVADAAKAVFCKQQYILVPTRVLLWVLTAMCTATTTLLLPLTLKLPADRLWDRHGAGTAELLLVPRRL